jgi:hypothetical protein
LEAFKRELKDYQQEVVEKFTRKARMEGSLQFCSKGNEDQYNCNSIVGDVLSYSWIASEKNGGSHLFFTFCLINFFRVIFQCYLQC